MRFWLWTFSHNQCAFSSAILYCQSNFKLIHRLVTINVRFHQLFYIVSQTSNWYIVKSQSMCVSISYFILSVKLRNWYINFRVEEITQPQDQCEIIAKKMRSILCLLLLSLTLSNAQQFNLRNSSGNFMWEIFKLEINHSILVFQNFIFIQIIHYLSYWISFILSWIHYIGYLTVCILCNYI